MVIYLVILILFICLIGLYLGYYYTFARSDRRCASDKEIPKGKHYAPYRTKMMSNIEKLLNTPWEEVTIESYDGLSLFGRYYHHKDTAPLVILFHGYRSSPIRDASGGFWLFREKGYNILLVDQRAHGKSQGRTITFGIKERYDCQAWVRYISDRLGENTPIFLLGISMGASTVLMASEMDLPGNVRGIIGDCGYSSVKGILKEVMGQMKLPGSIGYPLLRFGAKVFGKFDPEEASPREALQHSQYPVLLIHGEDDRFVPCKMTHENHEACSAVKEILTVSGAGHGMSFYNDPEGYSQTVIKFLDRCM